MKDQVSVNKVTPTSIFFQLECSCGCDDHKVLISIEADREKGHSYIEMYMKMFFGSWLYVNFVEYPKKLERFVYDHNYIGFLLWPWTIARKIQEVLFRITYVIKFLTKGTLEVQGNALLNSSEQIDSLLKGLKQASKEVEHNWTMEKHYQDKIKELEKQLETKK